MLQTPIHLYRIVDSLFEIVTLSLAAVWPASDPHFIASLQVCRVMLCLRCSAHHRLPRPRAGQSPTYLYYFWEVKSTHPRPPMQAQGRTITNLSHTGTWSITTGHTLVQSTLFPRHFNVENIVPLQGCSSVHSTPHHHHSLNLTGITCGWIYAYMVVCTIL
jgi:hypothetical protein